MTRMQDAARALWDGTTWLTRRIATRAAAWVARGQTKPHRVVRLLLVLLGLYILARIIRAAPNLLWLITVAWCWAAVRAGRRGPAPPPAPDQPAQSSVAADVEVVRDAYWGFIETASEGRQGVHLRDLLAVLQRGGHHPGWEVADVRAMCEGLGIPVRQRVRVRGKGVTVGIHRTDFPTPSSPSPAPPSRRRPENLTTPLLTCDNHTSATRQPQS